MNVCVSIQIWETTFWFLRYIGPEVVRHVPSKLRFLFKQLRTFFLSPIFLNGVLKDVIFRKMEGLRM